MSPLAIIFDPVRDQRELYRDYFEWANVDVVMATSAHDAVERSITARPDVIVAWVDRRDAAHQDVYASIRERSELRHVPVLLLTTSVDPLPARTSGDGPVVQLLKPALPKDVLDAARRLMRQSHMWEATSGLRRSALKARHHAIHTIGRTAAVFKKLRR